MGQTIESRIAELSEAACKAAFAALPKDITDKQRVLVFMAIDQVCVDYVTLHGASTETPKAS